METVKWSKFKFDVNGGKYPQSKIHYTEDRGETTVCGLIVPDRYNADTEGGDTDYSNCKKCQLKHKNLESIEQNFNISLTKPKKPSNTEIEQWLRQNPEIGALNNGKFYVYPVGGEYREVKPLEKI